jgi:MFS family permease
MHERWRGLTVGLVLNVTFVAFEALAIATIMPLVTEDLGGIALYGWVFSAFLLADLVGIVIAGELADRFGPALPFGAGLALFAVGLLIGGLAPSMPVLVAARAIQGFGAGAIPAVAYVVIGRTYPDALRPRMFAILSTAWVVPGIAGPALAAFVADHVGWRSVFLGLLPLVIVAGSLALRELRSVPGNPDRVARRVLLDAVRVAGGAGLALAGLQIRDLVLSPVMVALGLLIGVPALRKLLPPGTFAAREGLPAAVLSRGILTFAFFAPDIFVPLTVTTIRGESVVLSGLALTAGTIAWTTGAWIQERTVFRLGAAPLVRNGFAFLAVGIAGMALVLTGVTPAWFCIPAWAVAGLGIGMAYSSISLTVLRHAPVGSEGATAASMQLADILGNALGTGIGAVAVAAAVASFGSAVIGVAITDGLAGAFAIGGVVVASRLRASNAAPSVESPPGRKQEHRAVPDRRQEQDRL